METNTIQIIEEKLQCLQKLNDNFISKFIKPEELESYTTILKNMSHIPKLALLGISGHGKSTLMNLILEEDIVNVGSGKAITEFPIELSYGKTLGYKVDFIEIDSLNDEILKEIFNEEQFRIWCDNKETFLSNISEYYSKLQSLTIDINDMKGSLWDHLEGTNVCDKNNKYHFMINDVSFNITSFIQKMVVYVDNELLRTITLVDLPGLYDKSQYRCERTKQYLENNSDFIAIVNNSNRIGTDSFIDESLSSYVLNTMIKNNIKDVLIIGTMTNKFLRDIKKEPSIKKCSDKKQKKQLILDTFVSKKQEIKQKLLERVLTHDKLLECNLLVHSNNIHIIMSSDADEETMLEDHDEMDELRDYISKVSDTRMEQLYDEFFKLFVNHKKYVQAYVENADVELLEGEKEKFDIIVKEIKSYIQTSYNYYKMNTSKESYLQSETSLLKIYPKIETKVSFFLEPRGQTVTATLRKLYHVSNSGETYDLNEDLTNLFFSEWKQKLKVFLKDIDAQSIKNKDEYKTTMDIRFNKLTEMNNISNNEIKALQTNISRYFMTSNQTSRKNNKYLTFEGLLESLGVKLIQYRIREYLSSYRSKAYSVTGVGTSNVCRKLICELFSFKNISVLKLMIDKELGELLVKELQEYHKDFNTKVMNACDRFYQLYEPKQINKEEISSMVQQLIDL